MVNVDLRWPKSSERLSLQILERQSLSLSLSVSVSLSLSDAVEINVWSLLFE